MFTSLWARALAVTSVSTPIIWYLGDNDVIRLPNKDGLFAAKMNDNTTEKIVDRYENLRRKCRSLCDRFGLQNETFIGKLQAKPTQSKDSSHKTMDRELQFLIVKRLKSCIDELKSKTKTSDNLQKDDVIDFITKWFAQNSDLSRIYSADEVLSELKQYLDVCLDELDKIWQSDKTGKRYEDIISWFSRHTMWMEMQIKKIEGPSKIIRDPIHGSIELHPILVAIMDTRQFQRLRNLHQLGGKSRVYPGAKHSRFEHSIGVCHLAGMVAQRLHDNQSGLNITDKEIICVQIAGLCHDLGHGPFSHMFEKVLKGMGKDIHHEQLSCDLFDKILKENPHIRENLTPKEILFIKEQINTDLEQTYDVENKKFLYEIVANKRNGVDVDKWDYLVRDHYFLGLPHAFDYHIIKFLRALKVEKDGKKEYMICARDIKKESLYGMFQARQREHRVVLFHRVTQAVEHMICDALLEASKELMYGGKTMAECVDNCDDYIKLTDAVYYDILNQEDSDEKPRLKKAKAIIQRIEERDLYPVVLNEELTLEASDKMSTNDEKNKRRKEMIKKVEKHFKESVDKKWKNEKKYSSVKMNPDDVLKSEDFIVDVATFDYGKGESDPVVEHMWFYKKSDLNTPIQLTTPPMLQTTSVLRVFYKCHNYEIEKLKLIRQMADKWIETIKNEEEFRPLFHNNKEADGEE